MEWQASRRDLVLTSLMAALPLRMTSAAASPLNPEQTIIKPPDALQWKTLPPFPPGSVDTCALTGETTAPGLYYTLVRWHPGYHERAALLFDRSLLHGAVGDLVVQQRRRFRPRRLRAGPRGQLRAPRRLDAALRRGDPQSQRAGGDRDLRHRTGQFHPQRSIEAALAGSVTARAGARLQPPCTPFLLGR